MATPPPVGGIVLATSRKTQDKELPLGATRGLPPIDRGVDVVVEGVCLLAVLIGLLDRRETGLVGILNEVPAAVENKLDGNFYAK